MEETESREMIATFLLTAMLIGGKLPLDGTGHSSRPKYLEDEQKGMVAAAIRMTDMLKFGLAGEPLEPDADA